MASFDIRHNCSPLQLESIGRTVGALHIFLVFEFDEGIAPGFFRLTILDEL